MRKLMIISFIAGLFLLSACSGSRNTATEQTPRFADQQLQEQVDDLVDKVNDSPENSEYRQQLANLYHQNGRSMDALKVLEAGLQLDPNDLETKYAYAEIASQVGEKRRAFTAYKEILQSAYGNDYLDRIAPKFSDAFKVTPIVATDANEAFADISHDGQKVIYQSDQFGNWDIFEMDLSTKNVTQITNKSVHEEAPNYNPDGKYIVYTSTLEDHRNVNMNMKKRDIMLYDRVNNRETNTTLTSGDDWHPRFSYDGKFIAFVSERDDLRDVEFDQLKGEVYVMEHDGRFQLRLTENMFNDGNPSIAPGSTDEKGTIYFDSDENGSFEIYKTDFKGEKRTQITFNPSSNDVSPDISPNGDKIVFFSDRDGNYELYLMNSDGSAQTRITANPADDINPVFSHDGNKILFHSNRNGNYDIFMLDLNDQQTVPGTSEVIVKIDQALQNLP